MSTNMKNVISETFFAMVKEKGVDKITVKDLVDTCHISRQTFYYHFQDILDVVEWSARKGVQRAIDRTLEAKTLELAMERVVEAARNNWEIVENLLKSHKRESIERIFADTLRDYVLALVNKNAQEVVLNYEDSVVAMQFYAYGIAGVLIEQCGKPDCDTKGLARQLVDLINGSNFKQI